MVVNAVRLNKLVRTLQQPTVVQPRYATVISVDSSSTIVTVRPSTASMTDGSQDVVASYLSATAPAVGARVRIEQTHGELLITGAVGPDSYAAQPFAFAAGRFFMSISAGVGSAVVTFPTGRFTANPVLTVNVAGGLFFNAAWLGYDRGGGTIQVAQVNVSTFAGTREVHWTATQMTSTSGPG